MREKELQVIGGKDMYGYIYKTTNLNDNKIYIGQHKGQVFDPNYYGSGSWFTNVLKKYGKDNFRCEVLEECETLETLNEREVYWIEYFQSRNPIIGYNLAKGGEQFIVGCTDQEIEIISNQLMEATASNIYAVINDLQKYGLRIYEKDEKWEATSYNSIGAKMAAVDNSIVVSFYTKKQMSITKEYAKKLDCPYWKYNLMVDINKIPDLMQKFSSDYQANKLIPEAFKGPGRGTTGVFLETQKHTKSVRMPLLFPPNRLL